MEDTSQTVQVEPNACMKIKSCLILNKESKNEDSNYSTCSQKHKTAHSKGYNQHFSAVFLLTILSNISGNDFKQSFGLHEKFQETQTSTLS